MHRISKDRWPSGAGERTRGTILTLGVANHASVLADVLNHRSSTEGLTANYGTTHLPKDVLQVEVDQAEVVAENSSTRSRQRLAVEVPLNGRLRMGERLELRLEVGRLAFDEILAAVQRTRPLRWSVLDLWSFLARSTWSLKKGVL